MLKLSCSSSDNAYIVEGCNYMSSKRGKKCMCIHTIHTYMNQICVYIYISFYIYRNINIYIYILITQMMGIIVQKLVSRRRYGMALVPVLQKTTQKYIHLCKPAVPTTSLAVSKFPAPPKSAIRGSTHRVSGCACRPTGATGLLLS